MAVQENFQCISLPAAADFSSTGLYRFGVVNSSGQIAIVSSAGGDADGVIQGNPAAAGRACDVAFSGVVKVVAGTGGFSAGDKIQSDANGAGILAASGDHVLAKALEDTAAGAIGAVLLVSKHILA